VLGDLMPRNPFAASNAAFATDVAVFFTAFNPFFKPFDYDEMVKKIAHPNPKTKKE